MSERKEYVVVLKDRQYQYLTEMAAKYNMSDAAKAIRALVDFAVEEKEQEQKIFRQTRCFDC